MRPAFALASHIASARQASYMLWWHWLVIGLILVALEMAASGGFYVIFFGIAALAIAGLHVFDAAGPVWVQLLLFSLHLCRFPPVLPQAVF